MITRFFFLLLRKLNSVSAKNMSHEKVFQKYLRKMTKKKKFSVSKRKENGMNSDILGLHLHISEITPITWRLRRRSQNPANILDVCESPGYASGSLTQKFQKTFQSVTKQQFWTFPDSEIVILHNIFCVMLKLFDNKPIIGIYSIMVICTPHTKHFLISI